MSDKTIHYSDMVSKLAKPGKDILESLTPEKCHLLHMVSCIQGEAGELFDAIKKYLIYNAPLDMKNVVEELGDIEFYMEGCRQGLNLSRTDILIANYEKLSGRYGQTFEYSDKAAQERADKGRQFIGQPKEEK